jgi:4-hydroxybenzoate polyprenyltransferase
MIHDAEAEMKNGAIAVDLDGTLLRSDTLDESLCRLLATKPWMLFPLLLKLAGGKAAFKHYVASKIDVDPANVPVHSELLAYLKEEKERGRRIGLFSAADTSLVEAFAARFGIFDVAVGSDGSRNLSGEAKLSAIRERFGGEFVYAGDAAVDLPIWRASKGAIVVGPTTRLRSRIGGSTPVEREFPTRRRAASLWIRALRMHQWAKNALVFVAAVLAAPTLTLTQVLEFALAFAALCLVASATYLVNDLCDLASDRRHRSKRHRPLASGELSIRQAAAAAALLALGAAVLGCALPRACGLPIAIYVGGTLAYSLRVKRIAILDVLCLGLLFTVRIAAGASLIPDGPTPFWLFAFSMFFFTSLALVKRYTELVSAGADARTPIIGRGYQPGDAGFILAAGVATALASLVVFLIYLGEQHFNRALFAHPLWLGLVGGVLAYWILRIWLLAIRDEMHEDPVLFAITDRSSYAMAAAVGIALLLAW